MSCDDVRSALSAIDLCQETSSGSRVTTHCLYPSHEMVRVFVAKVGDGYKVHDDGGAYWEAWSHGRDEALISRAIKKEADHFSLSVIGTSLVAHVPTRDWLLSAILAISNASSSAARRAVEKLSAAAEAALAEKIGASLIRDFGKACVASEVEVPGISGGKRRFDFMVSVSPEAPLLINGVLPHRGSVSSKYVAFADTNLDQEHKFAVFDRPLDTADAALLQQVAQIVPFASMLKGAHRVLSHVGS